MALRSVVVFGGTGAQAGPIVRYLSATNKFRITVPTRNLTSNAATALSTLSNVVLIEANYNTESGLRASFADQEVCYFLINSFDIREPDEYFWTIRAYEIAVQSGLKHFVYSGARNRLRENAFAETYRNSHNTVKAHLSDWLQLQDKDILPWTIVYGGVYAEMLGSLLCPLYEDEEFVFAAPVHENNVIPLMPLENYGSTVAWVMQNLDLSRGRFLDAGAIPVTWPEIVASFVSATGKKARFQPITQEQWMNGVGKAGINPDDRLPRGAMADDAATFTFAKTFGAWWNMWKDNTKDIESLGRTSSKGESVPGRITSLTEWMKNSEYNGQYREPTKMRQEL